MCAREVGWGEVGGGGGGGGGGGVGGGGGGARGNTTTNLIALGAKKAIKLECPIHIFFAAP